MKRLFAVVVICLASAALLAGQSDKTSKPASKAAARAADPVAGKAIYKSKCAICHFDTSTAERVGPGMKGLFQAEKMERSELPPSEENVRKMILEGFGTMQPFRGALNRQQMDDLIAYLKTL